MGGTDEEETEELKQFREQWKREVQQKRKQHQHEHEHEHTAAGPSASGRAPSPQAPAAPTSPAAPKHPKDRDPDPHPDPAPRLPDGTFLTGGSRDARDAALEAYAQAVQHEQAGALDAALRLYRQAFRLDARVDRAYHLREQAAVRALVTAVVRPEPADAAGAELAAPHSHPHPDRHVSGLLARVIEGFPSVLAFEPEDERAPALLARLPDELLVLVLGYLGTGTIERFAAVSRKARVISLDSTIWRSLVEDVYKPPQISPEEVLDDIVDEHDSDYRRVYIERPRVRLDGVYIAVCHYIRQGVSENAWVNINHLITYHRYLRFYPDGQVISLLANEEHPPQHVITMLKPTLRMKGFFIGTWELSGTMVRISNLIDPSNASARYSFQMTLSLRSRPVGRWNKLEFDGYDSVKIEDGEATPLALKNERPFWFSKVRSFSNRME